MVSTIAARSWIWTVPLVALIFAMAILPARARAAVPGAQGTPSAKATDFVIFKNGDRVTGRLVTASYESVTFHGNATGDLNLDWADIDHVTVTSTLSIHTSNTVKTAREEATITTASNERLVIDGTGKPVTINRQDLESTATPPKKSGAGGLLSGWGATLQSQNNLIRSTQKQTQLGATFHAGRQSDSQERFKHQTTAFNLQAIYNDSRKPSASAVITSLYSGGIQQNVYLTDTSKTYAYALGDAYHNSSLGLNVEQEYGGGIGWKGRTKRQTYGLSGDLRYLHEDLKAGTPSLDSAAFGATENYQYRFPWPKKGPPVVFVERILVLIPFSDSRAIQARGLAQINVPFNSKFSIGVQLIDDYLRNAPPTSKQNYSNTQYTLKYTFGVVPN
jgi:hypothetical protein